MKFTLYSFILFLAFASSGDKTNVKDFGGWKKYAANIGGMYNGEIETREEFWQIFSKGEIIPPRPVKDCSLEITSFTLLLVKRSGNSYFENVKGSKLTPAIISQAQTNFKPGDILIIYNILGKCKQSQQEMELPSMVFGKN